MILHNTINVGDVIGMWEVISPAEPVRCGGRNIKMWTCKCRCGTIKDVREPSLKREDSKSCGCTRQAAMLAGVKEKATTHGMSNTRLYAIYKHMNNRCYRKSDIKYPKYGGRGITVCDEWLDSFEAFADWALNNGYSDNLSIDRINVDGNYCPENCRWADDYVQNNNRSNSKKYTYNNQTLTIAEWARLLDMNYKKLWKRLEVFEWDIERALTT